THHAPGHSASGRPAAFHASTRKGSRPCGAATVAVESDTATSLRPLSAMRWSSARPTPPTPSRWTVPTASVGDVPDVLCASSFGSSGTAINLDCGIPTSIRVVRPGSATKKNRPSPRGDGRRVRTFSRSAYTTTIARVYRRRHGHLHHHNGQHEDQHQTKSGRHPGTTTGSFVRFRVQRTRRRLPASPAEGPVMYIIIIAAT